MPLPLDGIESKYSVRKCLPLGEGVFVCWMLSYLGAIGQKVCLYLGVDAGHHLFFAEKVNRRRLFRLDKKCVWLLTFTQVVCGYSR